MRLPETTPPAPGGSLRLPETPAPSLDPAQRLPADSFGTPPPPARKGLPVWAMILIGVVGLCGVGCIASFAIAGFVLPGAVNQAATSVVATLEADSSPTDFPLPTEAVELTEPTPTSAVVLALPTKGPSNDTPPATDDIFADATEAFRDEYNDNSNGWLTGSVGDNEVDLIEDGVFKVKWAAKEASYETYGEREFTNFIAQLDCKIEKGGVDGACGIIFAETEGVGYYRFQVYEDYYSLYKIEPDKDSPPLLEGDPSDQINKGDWNHMRVMRRGDEISIYLNEELLGTFNDSSFGTGHVGVSTASFAEAGDVEVWFDNFTIWELP
jgi:hypothetical protein